MPPAEAFGVASFYALLSLQPRPPLVVHVCDDIACRANGAEAMCQELERRIGVQGAPVSSGGATWLRSPCLGQCDRAPAALVQRAGSEPRDWTMTNVTVDAMVATLDENVRLPPTPLRGFGGTGKPDTPYESVYADPPRLLRRVGVVDPRRLDAYRAHGGYEALTRALDMGRDAVIHEVTDARLVGRGGALFPTGRKCKGGAESSRVAWGHPSTFILHP